MRIPEANAEVLPPLGLAGARDELPRAASGVHLSGRAHYVHVLPGRVRVRMSELRGCAEAAVQIEAELGRLAGVRSASASALTGGVLICYDAQQLAARDVLQALLQLEVSSPDARDGASRAPGHADHLAQCPGCGTAWIAPQRAGGAFRIGSPAPAPDDGADLWRPLARRTVGFVVGELIEFAAKRVLFALI